MKKLLSLVLALCLALSLLSVASAEIKGGTVIEATPELYAATNLSSPYTVNIFLIGDKPNDWDRIEGLINDYLKPFNTSIATTFSSWSDYTTMYSLSLTGSDYDLIFTAPWCYLYTEAPKGSFYTLTEDFIATYMPLTKQYQAEASWDETTIGGQIVAVPSNVAQPMGKMVAIRQDIADKYGISSIDSWEDYMNFCLTVAEKETPESGIYAMAASGNNNELWDVYREGYDTMLATDSDYFDMIYCYDGKTLPTFEDISFTYATDIFRNYCKDMKTLADAGCWSRSALTNTITDDDAFGNLQGASIAWNTSVFTYMKQAEKTEGVYCTAYDFQKDHFVGAEAYSNNDMAITAGSRNPERAAMVLDIMKMDTYVNHMLILGVEGENYTVDSEGYFTKLDQTNYPSFLVSASWAIKNGDLNEAGAPEREQAISDAWQARVMNNPTVTFVFDDTNVKPYLSAVKVVLENYVPMLELGLVDDVDATLDQMVKECYDNGMQIILDEYKTQYDAWYATR